MFQIRELTELSPIVYNDALNTIKLECYADTLVYHKASSKERNLVAMRFGGYPEHVRGIADALNHDAGVETVVEGHTLILTAQHPKYKRSITHDGIYAEGTMLALDDENSEVRDDNEEEKEKSKDVRRKMYIFCAEGDTDSLYEELDKKTAIPLIPEFKDYVLSECFKKKILVQLEVLSASTRFDAYMLELDNEEKEMENIINKGLKQGLISIPNAVPGSGFEDIETVSQYLNKYGITIANRIRESFNPLFDPSAEDICDELKRINGKLKKNVGYSLYPAQLAVAEAVKRRLDKSKVGVIVAECGSGKTKIGSSALAAHQMGKKAFNVILCPSHITRKWVREIEETLPNTKAEVIHNLADVDRVYKDYQEGNKTMYAIISKERARDGYMRKPAAVYSKIRKAFVCPWCNEIIEMEDKVDGTNALRKADSLFFKKETTQNHKCRRCHMPLWTVLNPNDLRVSKNQWVKIGGYGFVYRDFASSHLRKTEDPKILAKINDIIDNPDQVFIARGAYRRYAVSSYISERIKQIDGIILDELHQFKGDSGQGDAMETLVGCSRKVIGMTATLINGYSSGMFYLLYRIVPYLMQVDDKEYDSPTAFNEEYGVTEKTFWIKEGNYNANSKSSRKLLRTKQKPGVSPLVYSRFLIDCAVFLSLNDMGKHLPEYEEIPVKLKLKKEVLKEYKELESQYKSLIQSDIKLATKLMSKFFSIFTTYPDQPYNADTIKIYEGFEIKPKDLSNADELQEKDLAAIDIVEKKVANGDKVLIYTSWVKIDTQDKLKRILEEKGYRVAVLEPKVIPEKREEWVEKRLEEGLDVLITNPSLVETGLDLNAFTTLIFYNIGYNLFTFRQASRRSWRINQTADRIEVYLLYYSGVMQERALRLMATKLAAATLVEGNFSDEGLAAMSDSCDMTSELARELTKGIKGEIEDIAEMYKKMAILKDGTAEEEYYSDYIIEPDAETGNETVTVESVKVVSISEKIQQAVLLAKRANSIKETKRVKEVETNYSFADSQLSLFDLLEAS